MIIMIIIKIIVVNIHYTSNIEISFIVSPRPAFMSPEAQGVSPSRCIVLPHGHLFRHWHQRGLHGDVGDVLGRCTYHG